MVSSFTPAEIVVGSGERYLTIEASNFISGTTGPVVVFAGPNGPVEITPSTVSGYELRARIQVWLPQEVVQTIGRYRVSVSNAVNGESDPFYLQVTGDSRIIIHTPSYISVEATGPSGMVVTYAASAESTVGAEIRFGCAPASGSTFPLGHTAVTCTGSTADGASRSVQFPVTVFDGTPPVLTIPQDIVVDATALDGAVVHFETSAADTVDTDVPVHCHPASGSQFPIRTTEVRCSATDDGFNSTFRSFTVTVTDNAFPMLMLPEDITVPATSRHGAVVTFRVTAMDYLERSLPVECAPASGTLFPPGISTVSCIAVDDMDRFSSGVFRVTVTASPREEPPPALILPTDLTVEAATPDGTAVTFTAAAQDEQDGALPVSCTPASGTTFPIGTTAVTCSATNSRGATASGTFEVRVVDTTAPAILSIAATPNRLWPVNKRLVNVTVSVTAADDGHATLRTRIVSVAASESFSDADWRIVDDLTVALRAARNGKEQPRIYTIIVEVSDSSGNIATATVDVIVPHDGTDSGTAQPVTRRRSARH